MQSSGDDPASETRTESATQALSRARQHSRTALAEAELEYQERKDTSIFVNFPYVDSVGVERESEAWRETSVPA